MSPCGECGGVTEWDDDAGSPICTTCGTLADATQTVFTSGDDYSGASTTPIFNPGANSACTLKSQRNPNWSLPGQSKDARHRQNASAMNEFIMSLTSTLNVSGLAPRAATLFTQAMTKGEHRWGRKAKLVAGACLSIALRESKRPDSRHDIAFLCDEKPVRLTRVFAELIRQFELKLPASDASFYLPTLQLHLSAAIHGQVNAEATLPSSVVAFLKPINMVSALSTARALSDLLAHSDASGPTASIHASAAAYLMLAVEGQTRTSLLGLSELAVFLAQKLNIGKNNVMKRYKVAQDELIEIMEQVPWLDKWKKRENGRSAVAKRVLVARGLADIITWGTEARRAKLQKPTLIMDEDSPPSDTKSLPRTSSSSPVPERPQKKQRLCRPLADASKFLLDPLSAIIPTASSSTSTRTCIPKATHPAIPMTSYLLSGPANSLTSRTRPTRLQMLSVAKTGNLILDEELFDDGELEGFIRSEEEVQAMSVIWAHEHPPEEDCLEPRTMKKRKRRADEPSDKLNHMALADFMNNFDGDDAHLGDVLSTLAFDFGVEGEEKDYMLDGKHDSGDAYESIEETIAREFRFNRATTYDEEGYDNGGETQDYW